LQPRPAPRCGTSPRAHVCGKLADRYRRETPFPPRRSPAQPRIMPQESLRVRTRKGLGAMRKAGLTHTTMSDILLSQQELESATCGMEEHPNIGLQLCRVRNSSFVVVWQNDRGRLTQSMYSYIVVIAKTARWRERADCRHSRHLRFVLLHNFLGGECGGVERLLQIGNQIHSILDAHRDPNEVTG